MMKLDFSDPRNIPKPVVGSQCDIGGETWTITRVTPKGGTITIENNNGEVLKCKRARVGRIPQELGLADVSPRYYTTDGRRVS